MTIGSLILFARCFVDTLDSVYAEWHTLQADDPAPGAMMAPTCAANRADFNERMTEFCGERLGSEPGEKHDPCDGFLRPCYQSTTRLFGNRWTI